jgi:hypothetical protein
MRCTTLEIIIILDEIPPKIMNQIGNNFCDSIAYPVAFFLRSVLWVGILH